VSAQSWSTGARLATLGRVVLFCMGCAVILMVGSRFTPKLPGLWMVVVLEGAASVATFGLTVLFARWEGMRLADVGVVPERGSLERLGFGAILGLLMVGLHTLLLGSMGHVHWVRQDGVGFAPACVAVLAFLLVGLREEMAFRGYPLRGLERAFGPWVALGVVSLFFALEHIAGGMTWRQAIWGPLVGGLLFGLAALVTRGIALPVGIHAGWDYAYWMLGYRGGSGPWRMMVEPGFEARVEQVAMMSYLVVMGSGILGFLLYSRMTDREIE
jgi:membrane protease YdiL (CAAX protease family)